MSSKKSDGFEDWESDFFSEGEQSDLSWEEEEAKRLEEEAAVAKAELKSAEGGESLAPQPDSSEGAPLFED